MKCAYGDLRILTISRIKSIKIYIFVLISFRNLVRSIHPTTCRSMFSEANACARVARSGENWRDPCFIHLRSPEQFEKVPCLSEGYELSVAIDKNVKKTNGTGSGFRRWTRTEYRFDIGVESSMSQGLHLKKIWTPAICI